MFISEFWCGVIVTVLVELVCIIGMEIEIAFTEDEDKKNK